MRIFKIDVALLIITALVSFIATVAIVFFINFMQPGLIVSTYGTSLFVYIGVFTANLIIEAVYQRTHKN